MKKEIYDINKKIILPCIQFWYDTVLLNTDLIGESGEISNLINKEIKYKIVGTMESRPKEATYKVVIFYIDKLPNKNNIIEEVNLLLKIKKETTGIFSKSKFICEL